MERFQTFLRILRRGEYELRVWQVVSGGGGGDSCGIVVMVVVNWK